VDVDPAAILALAGEPWRDRQGFVEALEAALGGLELDMPRLPEAVIQPPPKTRLPGCRGRRRRRPARG
jgi:hypothetical protein